MNTALHYHRAGMGQTTQSKPLTTAQTAASAGAGYSAAAAQIINGNYVSGAGTVLLTTALLVPYPANLFLAAAGALADLLGAIGIGKGCGQTCITASNYANQAENILRQNLNTYLALSPRTQSAQQAALNIFDQTWQGLVSVCSNPALNDAGKRCISDRQQGSCAYKTSPGAGCQPTQSNCWTQDSIGNCTFNPGGPNGSGNACWNWFIGYRDPIANDPCVVPDTATSAVSGAISTLSSATGIDPTLLMIGGGLMVVLMLAGNL